MNKKSRRKRINPQHHKEKKRALINKAILDDYSQGQQNLKQMMNSVNRRRTG